MGNATRARLDKSSQAGGACMPFPGSQVINLERVGFNLKNFDMAIVFKDFSKDVSLGGGERGWCGCACTCHGWYATCTEAVLARSAPTSFHSSHEGACI